MATPESPVVLEFGRYQTEIRTLAQDILVREGFSLEDGDVVVDVLPFEVEPRTEAALSMFFEDNEVDVHDERVGEITEEVYRLGLRMHALVSFLGEAGIRLVAASKDGTAVSIRLGSLGDPLEPEHEEDHSMMGMMVEALQVNIHEESGDITERAELSGSPRQVQQVGLSAILRAVLDYEMNLTHISDADLMNRSAQLFCMLASVQSAGGRLLFADSANNGLPVMDDFNSITDKPSDEEDREAGGAE